MRKTARMATALGLALMLASAPASAARRSSLGGNLLIEDFKDVFWLPHEVARYVNYVWFDFVTGVANPLGIGPGNGDPALGSGGILFGNAQTNDFGFGIATHRADYQGSIRQAFSGFGDFFMLNGNQAIEDGDTIYDGFPLDTLQWLDLLAGFSIGVADLGVRLAVGSNVLSREDREGADAGVPNPGSSVTSFDFVFSAGIGDDDDDMQLDFALELTFANFSNEAIAGGDPLKDDGSTFGFSLGGRGLIAMTENIDLGLLTAFDYRGKSVTLDDTAGARPDDEASELGFLVGVGPVYKIGEEATISAYVTLGVQQRTRDPEGSNNLEDSVSWLLPGVHIAAEWWLTEWFAYRAGLVSEYRLNSGQQQEDNDAGGSDFTARSILFYWSTGIGLSALEGDFNFDAMINWPIITDGPYILSGNSNGMFGMVSASYAF